MVNFPTQIPDCDSHSPVLLDLYISSDTSIWCTMAFLPLGNSGHVVVSVRLLSISINLPYIHAWSTVVMSRLVLVATWSQLLAQLLPLSYSQGRSTGYCGRFYDSSVTIRRCYKDVYVNSFFPLTARLWNSLPIQCILLTYDLSGFESRINWHFLTLGPF